MNKAQLIDAIATRLALPKQAIADVLEAQADAITEHLASLDQGIEGEAVLPGLGKLKTTLRAARSGRNPQTGAEIEIPERVAVKFVAGKALGELLNAS